MNKQLLLIILLLLQSLSVFIPSTAGADWVIDGDTVYVDNAQVYLSVTPHTIIESDTVTFHLRSKQYSGNIDAVWLFNTSNCRPRKPVYFKIGNGEWTLLNKTIVIENITYQNYTKAYSLESININQGVDYYLKIPMEMTFNTSGKYWFGIKKTGDTWTQGLWLDPWWDSNWNYYRTITIDHTYIIAPLTNFPLMVYIPNTIAPSCDGGDSIRFISSNNVTAFAYEIEYWNVGGSYVWVNISETITSGSSYKFLMYYNNSGASDNQNPTGVWDSNYQFVHHMNETSDNIIDSTGYSNDGTKVGSPSYSNTGKIGNAIRFDGTNDCFEGVLAKADMDHDTSFFEFWVKPDYADTIGIALGWVYTGDNRFMLGQADSGAGTWRYGWGDQYEYYGTADTNWHYLSYRVTSGEVISAYVDGTFYISENSAAFGTGTSDIFIGVGIENTATYRFDGLIDEVRISNSSRNASWRNASFHSMNQTTGFLTWGSEIAGLSAPTGFIATTLSDSEIFLNWTKEAESTHTYLVRKTGGYPASRSDGTNIYNNTGVNYTDDTGLSIMTAYYYSAWGFNSTTGNWSTSAGTTNHTGPANPTSVNGAVGTGYLNATWTKGTRADNTTVVRKATGYPTSPTDGTEIYNSSGLFYNDTGFSDGYYKLFSWNDTVELFSSGANVLYGSLTIRVYDENTSDAITGWDVFITDEEGVVTYENTGNNNPLLIDIDDLPTGANTAIKINATDYDFRLYYMDIYANNQYVLDGYLSPENISELYVLIVVDEYDEPVDNAQLQIQQYINATSGYKNISVRITDANGQIAVYLIPGSYNSLYKIIISKTGYETEIADYIPDSVYYGIYYPKIFEIHSSVEDVDLYTFWDLINFNATMYTNNTIKVMYEDTDTNTTNAQFYTYETFNFSSVLNATNTTTSDTFTFWIGGVNASREHEVILHLNHTVLGYVVQTIIVLPVYTPKYSNIETKIRAVFGEFELNFSHLLFVYLPAIILLVIFSKKRPEIGCVGSGLWMGFVGIYLAIPVEAAALVPFIVTLGIILIIVKGGKSKL